MAPVAMLQPTEWMDRHEALGHALTTLLPSAPFLLP
jgi:hypothetical protein